MWFASQYFNERLWGNYFKSRTGFFVCFMFDFSATLYLDASNLQSTYCDWSGVRCFSVRQFMSLWIYCQLLFRLFLKFTSLKTPGNDACLTGKGSLREGNAFLIILIIRPCLADEWWQRQSDKVCEKYFLLLLLRSSFSSWHIVPRYELSLCTIENVSDIWIILQKSRSKLWLMMWCFLDSLSPPANKANHKIAPQKKRSKREATSPAIDLFRAQK